MNSGPQRSSVKLPPWGVLIESHRHGPGFQTAAHKHPCDSLVYVVAGEGRCIIDGREHDLRRDAAVVLGKGRLHQLVDRPGKAMVVFVVYFGGRAAAANEQVLRPLLQLAQPTAIPPHHAHVVRRALRQMLHEQGSGASRFDFAMKQCLSAILLELYRAALTPASREAAVAAAGSTARVAKVLDHVARQYYEPQSLSAAARMARLSQRQFTNVCRKLKGQSFIQYVSGIRVAEAAGLLAGADMPVAAIAFEVGFEELSTFYRAFKKHYRTSPLAFRADNLRVREKEGGGITHRVRCR